MLLKDAGGDSERHSTDSSSESASCQASTRRPAIIGGGRLRLFGKCRSHPPRCFEPSLNLSNYDRELHRSDTYEQPAVECPFLRLLCILSASPGNLSPQSRSIGALWPNRSTSIADVDGLGNSSPPEGYSICIRSPGVGMLSITKKPVA